MAGRGLSAVGRAVRSVVEGGLSLGCKGTKGEQEEEEERFEENREGVGRVWLAEGTGVGHPEGEGGKGTGQLSWRKWGWAGD